MWLLLDEARALSDNGKSNLIFPFCFHYRLLYPSWPWHYTLSSWLCIYWQHKTLWSRSVWSLTSLDPNKPKGIDMISPKILKYCAATLVQPVHHLFSLSLSQQLLPLDWKTHIFISVLKSGIKTQVNNYHSISLFYIIFKVLNDLFTIN